MKRLLFISPGNNLEHLGEALHAVAAEQAVELQARNFLTYQISDGLVSLDEVRASAEAADIVLVDIRAFPALVDTLRDVRNRFPDKTFIPLMGGSMDVMGLCRMASFSFDRMRPSSSGGSVNFRRITQITNLIDRIGGLLPLGALKHARAWIHVVRYWTAGGRDNIANLVRLVVRLYCGGTGPAPASPHELPQHFLCSADGAAVFTTLKAWRDACPFDPALPTVAVLHYGGLHRDASLVALQALACALAGRANVLPIATNGVESLEPLKKFLLGRRSPRVDALVSLLWFRLDGGPMGGSEAATLEALRALDAPYCVPVTLYGREARAWAESDEGASPVETFATVVLPELDGALLPVPVLAVDRQEHDGFQATAGCALPDRVAAFADRVLTIMSLRRISRADKRIALVVYDYPPGPAHAGSASYLDTGASLAAMFERLAAEGYDTGGFTGNPLKPLLADGVHNDAQGGPWQGLHLAADAYGDYWQSLPGEARQQVEAAFGPPPGGILADAQGLRIPGRWFGRVLVVFEPARMPLARDAAVVHDRALPPHHQYLAVYRYLELHADAVVHVGTHGTAEFTPGKQTALSRACFPDLLRGATPHIYLYTIANPSEASIAKRRLLAQLVSHHTPDFIPAGLYGDYQELLDLIERAADAGLARGRAEEIAGQARRAAAGLDLPADDLDALADELRQMKHAAIPRGLHVFGQAKDGAGLTAYIAQLFRRSIAGVHVAGLAGGDEDRQAAVLVRWARHFVSTAELAPELAAQLQRPEAHVLAGELAALARRYLAAGELDGLIKALDGRYVEAGLLGDGLRSPGVYPTGRNGCAFDPTRIPFPDAVARGAAIARQLMERQAGPRGAPPRTVGLVLWGFETARSGGETVGAFLHLVGARLKAAPGWLPAFEPVPAGELGRPRVDVYLMICGFFRDMFPNLVRDLDALVRDIAALDEPDDVNPLRTCVRSASGDLGGELAGARIFGPPPGQYGTGIPDLVEASQWGQSGDIGRAYARAMGHAYGARLRGEAAHAAFDGMLAATDAVTQVIDGEEYKIGDLDHYYEFLGGACRAVENRRGDRPACLVGDSARLEPRLVDAADALRQCSVTRLLNPAWIDGMLAHDLHGAQQIRDRVTNLVGLAATVGVPSSLFDRVFERFLDDDKLFARLRDNNVNAALATARRMAEAAQRGYWQADESSLHRVRDRVLQLEAELE